MHARKSKHSRMDRLELRHLRLLYETSRSGSLSLAASELRLSQPSATRLMNELEEAFGDTLTVRGPGGTKLTEYGADVLALVTDMIGRMDDYQDLIALRRAARTPSLRVGNTGSRFVSTATMAFARKLPGAELMVIEGPFDFLYTMLHNDEIDVVVGPLAGDTTGCVCLPTYSAPLAFIVASHHPLAGAAQVTWRELTRYRWIVPRKGTTFRKWLDEQVAANDVAIPRGSIQSASQSLNHALLFESTMILTFPEHFNGVLIEHGLLRVLHVVPELPSYPFGIVYRQHRAAEPVIAAFLTCFKSSVESAPARSSR